MIGMYFIIIFIIIIILFFLRFTAVSRGWNGYRKLESAQKVDPPIKNIKNSPAVLADSNLQPFDRVRRSTTELAPAPQT